MWKKILDLNEKLKEEAEEKVSKTFNADAEEDFINLEHNIQKMVLNHPIQSANFVKSLPNIPPDVDIIISQHH